MKNSIKIPGIYQAGKNIIPALLASSVLFGCAGAPQKQAQQPPEMTMSQSDEQSSQSNPADGSSGTTGAATENVAPPQNVNVVEQKTSVPDASASNQAKAVASQSTVKQKKKKAVARKVVKAESMAKKKAASVKALAATTSPKMPKPEKKSAPETVVKKVVAVKAVAKAKASASGKFKPRVSMKDLPVRYGAWIVEESRGQSGSKVVITTPTWQMGEGDHISQIWFTISAEKVMVNSSSDVDISRGKEGLQIDKGELIKFDEVFDKNIGIINGDYIKNLGSGSMLNIYMGFFPDRKPLGKVYKSDVSLKEFYKAATVYNLLNQK